MKRRLLPFWEHVEELRRTLIKIGLTLFLSWIFLFSFHEHIFRFFLAPFQAPTVKVFEKKLLFSTENQSYSLAPNTKVLTPDISISEGKIALPANTFVEILVPQKNLFLLGPLEGFMTSLKLTFWAAVAFSFPFCLYFALQFVQPAMTDKQKRPFFIFLALSALLIFLGLCAAYKVTIPLLVTFFKTFNENIGENLWSVKQTTDLTVTLLLGHALVFELFACLLFLIHFGFFSHNQLKKMRRAVIVASLIIAAILTPPDVLSQVLLALPMILLYEIALLYAYFKRKKRLSAVLQKE